MAHLKLVSPTLGHKSINRHKARPICTEYRGATRTAHSTTEKAAINSAVRRIVAGDYDMAKIYNGKKSVAWIVKNKNKIYISVHQRGVL